jgi:hypothetical protein
MLMRPFYFSIHNLAKTSLFEEIFAMLVVVFLMYNADVIGKHISPS